MSSTAETAVADRPYPKKGTAWYMVILLTIAYIFSYVDRYILGLLVEPVKADLGLTDTQLGLLGGFAFALFYGTMGLPLGWLADRKRRTWIVSAGVAVWSIATVACGLAKNFWHLFFARMAVGAGEATLSPCAMSMISDSFPKEERGKPIAFYTAALSVGAAIASLVSAAVLSWAKTRDDIVLPLLGEVAPWQFTFIIVGLPGVLLAIMIFFLREPVRRGQLGLGSGTQPGASIWTMLRYVGSRSRVFVGFVSIFCVMTIAAYSQFWLPAVFQRTYGWEAEQYAVVNAIVLLAFGPATVNLSGWWSDRMTRRGHIDTPLLIAIVGLFIMVPTQVAAPLMPTPVLAWVVLAINTVGIAMVSAVGITALLNIVPGDIRAQTVALYYMCISFSGLFIGPPLVGFVTDVFFGEAGLRYGFAVVNFIIGVPILLLTPFIRRWYVEEVRTFESQLA